MFRLMGRASVFKLLMGPKIDIVKPKLATNPPYISSRTYTCDFENPNKRHVGKHVSHDAPWPSGTGSALHGWPLGNKLCNVRISHRREITAIHLVFLDFQRFQAPSPERA